KVQDYLIAHVGEPVPVKRMADAAGTSARSIARLFVKGLRLTPLDFVENVRLDQERNLLEATNFALKAVAFDFGFTGLEQMRAVFQRRLGLNPQRSRESFQLVCSPLLPALCLAAATARGTSVVRL
ncbi:helix-turn-helix domain-containing protein, partial [Lichenifustis flavocetrariae]